MLGELARREDNTRMVADPGEAEPGGKYHAETKEEAQRMADANEKEIKRLYKEILKTKLRF